MASCQPVSGGPMDQVAIIVAMAQAAVAGGAIAVRIEGIENVRAVKQAVSRCEPWSAKHGVSRPR
ncbi:N-acetylmannosamine-6-phosphate epimerase family protein [Piscirickettsia salmonis LF-89 = ATCC VR-1361]|nr:N-acetylmannosamine-6-phosphate epimerase family protein [Piscirickettsia salmonis LF-89 = ATCC VR-1361]